jgi:hypothetical protein
MTLPGDNTEIMGFTLETNENNTIACVAVSYPESGA